MKLKYCLLALALALALNHSLFAQPQGVTSNSVSINNFILKENLLKNDKVAVIAADSNDTPLESVSGTFQFGINGFKQTLKFTDGVSILPQQIERSTFIYLRHENESGTHGKLFYIYKKDLDLKIFKINWFLLVLIPLIVIILATMFRKFILIAAVLLILLYVFNSSNGLKLGTFFETIFDGLRSVF